MSSMEREGSISSTCSDSSVEESRDGVGKKIKASYSMPIYNYSYILNLAMIVLNILQ